MWIHWKVQRVETSLGAVADFCPICRALRAFRIVEVERTTELLHVPLARTPLGRFLRCLSCDARIAADAEAYAAFAAEDEDDLETLIATTRPDLREAKAERLALEDRLRRSSAGLAPAERADLLFEPFQALEGMVRDRVKQGMFFDVRSALGCGGALLALIAGPWISRELPPSWQWLVGAMLGLSFALGLYTLFEFFRNPGRSAGQRVLPLLARALAPLKPLDEELALCLFHCRGEGWRIGKVVRLKALWEEIRSRETRNDSVSAGP